MTIDEALRFKTATTEAMFSTKPMRDLVYPNVIETVKTPRIPYYLRKR